MHMERTYESIENEYEMNENSEMASESLKEFFWQKQEKTETNLEIAERLKKLGVGDVNLEGVKEDWQRKIASSIEEMCENYPELKGNIGKICTKSLPKGVYACSGPTMYPETGYRTELQFDQNKFSKSNLEWQIVDMERENMFGERWLAGRGLDGVVKHELGHLLHVQMIAEAEGLAPGEYDEEKFKNVRNKFEHNAIAVSLCHDAAKELNVSAKDYGRELSAYGKTNFGEYFAEAISECESQRKPRRMAVKIKQKYEEYVKEHYGDKKDDPDITKEMRSIAEHMVTDSVIPKAHGEWADAEHPGNSAFELDDTAAITYRNKAKQRYESISGAELKEWMKENYGVTSVDYEGNEPNFTPFEDPVLGHAELEDFSIHRDQKEGTFFQARKIVSERTGMSTAEIDQYMRENNLTWHECGDCKTVRAVPTVINTAFKHTGGISIERSKVAIAEGIQSDYGHVQLQRESLEGTFSRDDLEENVQVKRKEYREIKSEL